MKKGFTLIELLAVIVILAIIALIATPIILGIINDARKESNERSVELYASAVRNAIASYQLTHPNAPTTFEDLDVQYDGNVVCATEKLYADGSFYIADCTTNGDAVEFTYGEKKLSQVYKPQYYYFGFDWSGTVGETESPENLSSVPPTGEIRYLGYDVTNGVVSTAYVCFVRNETEYCLKGYDADSFAKNTEVLTESFGKGNCHFEDGYSHCEAEGLIANVNLDIGVDADDGSSSCEVSVDGQFVCYEL